MADIDKLRGTPPGHTTKHGSNILKTATVTLAATAGMLGNSQSADAATVLENTNLKEKVENIVQKPAQTDNSQTIDFEVAAAQMQEQNQATSVENINDTASDNLNVNISYDADEKKYMLQSENGTVEISHEELKYGKQKAEYDMSQMKKFIRPTKEVNISVNLDRGSLQFDKKGNENKYAGLQMPVGVLEAYVPQLNGIINVNYEGANRKKNLQDALMQEKEAMGESLKAHELSHRDDDRIGAMGLINKSPVHAAKINMLSEIKANMVEAGIALQEFRETGSLDGFDKISNADLSSIKKELEENPNAENIEQKIAAQTYTSWLERHNKEGAIYSNQAFTAVIATNRDSYSAAGKLTDSQALDNEYYKTVDKMFKDVPGLGDVRGCVKPDFALNEELQNKINEYIGRDKTVTDLMNLVVSGAENARQANREIKEFLKPIQKADKDGIRTPEEQKKIDAHIAKTLLEKTGRQTQKSETPVKQTAIDIQAMVQNTNTL